MASISSGTGFATGTPNAITSQILMAVSATASGTVVSIMPTYSAAGGLPSGWGATATPSASVGHWNIQDMLVAVLGALVMGLVFGSITFGIVIIKALSFFRRSNTESGAVKTALFCMVLHLATSILAVAVLYNVTFAAVLLGYYPGDTWPMITTYSIVTGVDLVAAVVGYFWLQKVYVLKKQDKTTLSDELEYWTMKSLFGCALISLFNAIAVAVMELNMTWLAGTFVLGNLYTVSVLLTSAGARLPINRNTTPVTKIPVVEPTDPATLTIEDAAIWE
ncbi:hypothetical protein C8Q80DRAFT_1266601 [Daedaleopsis nitida]|nr:hypothetical protein C8Q80DRAFT_1266601 [Daedaleopsis nitida]